MRYLPTLALALVFAAAGLLTWLGDPEGEVNARAAAELWADVLRDADQLGLQLSRVSAREEMDLGARLAAGWMKSAEPAEEWQSYVEVVGQSVARGAGRKEIQYHFHALRSGANNAFALPGGRIVIYTGLLRTLRSEAELAVVLSHEIAHVDTRHAVERFQYRLRMARIGLEDAGKLMDAARALPAAGYAQYQEAEADALGLRLCTEAGYSPRAAIDLFRRMLESSRPQRQWAPQTPLDEVLSAAGGMLVEYLRSHPPTPERLRRMERILARLERQYSYRRLYVGVENYRRLTPRSRQEFPGETVMR
jgi:predicted Zn-dependent protease